MRDGPLAREPHPRARRGSPRIEEAFWHDLRVTGTGEELNQELERAGRVADYFELAELLCFDALHRNESAGGHFRVEYQTPEGEAARERRRVRLRRRVGVEGPGAGRRRSTRSRSRSSTSPSQQRSYK